MDLVWLTLNKISLLVYLKMTLLPNNFITEILTNQDSKSKRLKDN